MGASHIRIQQEEQKLTRSEWQELERNTEATQALQKRLERQQTLYAEHLKKQVLSPCLIKEDEDIPSPKRGLAGLIEADRILKKKGLLGILIGGLGRDLYSDEPSEQALAKLNTHKDVDVLVIPPEGWPKEREDGHNDWKKVYDTSKHFKKFEGGIDWWHIGDVENFDRKNGDLMNMQKFHNGYNGHNFFVLESRWNVPSGYLKRMMIEKTGLYILPQKFYEGMFSNQKEAEMLKLYPDFEDISWRYRIRTYKSEEKPLIPEIAKRFPVTPDLREYDKDFAFAFNQDLFDKVWDKQQGTLEQENKRRDELREELREATNEDERLEAAKKLSINQPNRQRQADELKNMRIVRDEYLKRCASVRKGKS